MIEEAVPPGEAVRRAFVELAAIAQTGLYYSQDPFDRQRYAQVGVVAEALRALVGAVRPPLAVLRIGHGLPTGSTPRRPTAELMLPD